MPEYNNYSSDRAVQPTDLDPLCKALAAKLAEMGILKPGIEEPHVHIQPALEAVIKSQGQVVQDVAWKDGDAINRYDESDPGFCGAPGKPVVKQCRRLVLTIVPSRWTRR